MIFAATPTNWLSLSITVLLVIFVVVCLLMAVVILIQRPKQDGLGAAFGGGVTDQLFGARSTDVFQKATWVLGSLFFLLCFTLMVLIAKQNKQKSLLTPEKATAEKVEKNPDPVVVPATPPASLATELPVTPTPAPAPETTPAPVAPTPPVETPAPLAPQN